MMALEPTQTLGDIWSSPSLKTAEAEQCLLGSLLIRNTLLDEISLIVSESDFSFPLHGRIYDLILQLCSAGKPADVMTVNRVMADDDAYKGAGGSRYIASVINSAFPPNASHYARAIADAAARRRFISTLQSSMVDAANPGDLRGFNEVSEEHERGLAALRDGLTEERGPVPMAEAVDTAMQAAEAVYKSGGRVMGVTTGLLDLDRAIGGLHHTDLIVIAGRPGMGKSALGTTIAEAAAADGKRVYFSSLEMSADQIAARQIAAASGVSVDRQRNGPLLDSDMTLVMEAGQRLRSLPITFDDMMVASVDQLRAKLKRHRRRYGLDLVIVDYLQLIDGGGRPDNRVNEVSAITRGLKGIAKDFAVPVVALSQLSRAVEQRDDKRPYLSDLRDSGSIEQDADIVLFLYREEYYLQREEPKRRDRESSDVFMGRHADWDERFHNARNMADIIVGKNRNGGVKTITVHFDAERTAFHDLAKLAL